MDYLDHSSSQNAESASLAGKEKITERQEQALRRSIGISAQVLLSGKRCFQATALSAGVT